MVTTNSSHNNHALYIKTADKIIQYITDSKLSLSDKLPSERDFSKSLNISRNIIRESYRLLEVQGIIEVRRGVGSFLKKDIDSIENLTVSLNFAKINYKETIEIKTALEILLIKNIIPSITDEHIASLQSILDNLAHVDPNSPAMRTGDYEFHIFLYNLSPNVTLKNIVTDLVQTLDSYWIEFGDFPYHLVSDTMDLHQQIVTGLATKDITIIESAYSQILIEDCAFFDSFATK